MKRIIFISILLSVTGFTHAGNNGYLGKSRAKKITAYFADRINGKETRHTQNKNIAVENIEEARSSGWSCWRNAVKDTKEEKLISPVTKEEPRDTGYWKLPDALEPNAIMPYYLIKKGDKPSDGYPLYL